MVPPLWFLLAAGAVGAPPAPGSTAQAAFEQATSVERQSAAEAASLYRELMARFPESPYAGEALMRLAVMADEVAQDPPEALRLYRRYLQREPEGRMAMRAQTRIAALEPYAHAEAALYRKYLSILANGDRSRGMAEMRAFIAEQPGAPLLDDALFWLANATKGPRSRSAEKADRDAARESIPLYERILREVPATRHRLAILKNLGDAHQVLGDYSVAMRYYQAVREEGGEQGELVVQQFSTGAAIKRWKQRLLHLALILMPLAAAALAWTVPFGRARRREALGAGLRHALYVSPVAALVAGLTFALTTAGKGGQTGAEPRLVTTCMIALLFFVFANGAVMKIDERQPVKLGLYFPALTLLTLAGLYSALYGLNLLSPFDRIFG